jgi:transposase
MTKKASPPEDLSRDEMWDMILQLRARVAELEAQLSRPQKTSRNSSVPPAQTRKGKRQTTSGKKRGAKAGHSGVSRENSEPDQVVECRAEICTTCGKDVSGQEQELVNRHQVVDIPPVKPMVIELHRYQTTCECGACVLGAYPPGYDEPQQRFGPGVHSLLSYFNGTHHVAHQRLQQMMEAVFGLPISAGAIANSLQRTAGRLAEPAYEILRDIRRSAVIGSDETGMRVEGTNWWLWTVQTPQASYFAIADTRSGDVLEALMFDAVAEVWCSDLFSAQLTAQTRRFAICHAHQLRDLQFAIDAGDTIFAPAFQLLLREGLHLTRVRDDLSCETYQRSVEALQLSAQVLLDMETNHPEGQVLQRRYHRHWDKLWVFLERDDVPFDNNASERALRPAVIHRKVIGGFRTEAGAEAYALYRTLEDTARKRGQPILDALHEVFGEPMLASQGATGSQ